MGSDIARFREQQELVEQAAHAGLSGYATVSRHDFIERRMEQGAIHIQELMDAGKHDEAFALMETDGWRGIPASVVLDEQEGRPT